MTRLVEIFIEFFFAEISKKLFKLLLLLFPLFSPFTSELNTFFH